MTDTSDRPLLKRIAESRDQLTPKGRRLADFILENPRQAVFLRTRGLAAECGVSESTVVRFVSQLGFGGYPQFIEALRDLVDSELTLMDRAQLSESQPPGSGRLRRDISLEIKNLQRLFETLDPAVIGRAADLMQDAPRVFCIGSRLSYTYAYYLGWALSRIRTGAEVLEGSDTTSIDALALAPEGSLAVIIATSRYPNELIKLCKVARRFGRGLITVTDSAGAPLNQFADLALVAPSANIPVVGNPASVICLINCLILELISRDGPAMREHQTRLEQTYLENDILFNLDALERQPKS